MSAEPGARATQKAEDRRAIRARRRVAGAQKALLAPRDGTGVTWGVVDVILEALNWS